MLVNSHPQRFNVGIPLKYLQTNSGLFLLLGVLTLSVQAVREAWITWRKDSTTKPNIAAATPLSMTTASTLARQVQTRNATRAVFWIRCVWRGSECLCWTSQECYEGGKEVIVVPKTTASSDSPWFGLAIYAWSGWVQLPCKHTGINPHVKLEHLPVHRKCNAKCLADGEAT